MSLRQRNCALVCQLTLFMIFLISWKMNLMNLITSCLSTTSILDPNQNTGSKPNQILLHFVKLQRHIKFSHLFKYSQKIVPLYCSMNLSRYLILLQELFLFYPTLPKPTITGTGRFLLPSSGSGPRSRSRSWSESQSRSSVQSRPVTICRQYYWEQYIDPFLAKIPIILLVLVLVVFHVFKLYIFVLFCYW